MRHRKDTIKLGRTSSHRNAMFRNMVTSLLKHDKIRTTDTKAKELRRWADHLITLAKRGDLHARRQALAIVREKGVVHKLFEDAADRFGGIAGGYTRIIKIGRRPGDAAPMSLIELVAASAKKLVDKKAPEKTEKKTAVTADTSDEADSEADATATAAEASGKEGVVEAATDETAPEAQSAAADESAESKPKTE